MTRSQYQVPYFELTSAPKHALPQHVFRSARRPKCHNWCLEKQKKKCRLDKASLNIMCVGSLAGVTYLRYTVLMSCNKSETAVHCCDPALSLLVLLVSLNVFRVVPVCCLYPFFWLIRSLVDPALAALIICSPLQLFGPSF